MKVTCIGGGPGGLYTALLLAKAGRGHEITVYERQAASDTFGWGVVFSASTLGGLADADADTYDAILSSCARWDPVDVVYRGTRVRARGNRFAAIARKRLLAILQERCRELGVSLRFGAEVADPAAHLDADLVVAADGVHSVTRSRLASAFAPTTTVEGGKFIWLVTTKPLRAFTFLFTANEHGRFQVHAYPFDEHTSTWIVECDERSWRNAGMDAVDPAALRPGESDSDSIEYCRRLFADELDGHKLLGNGSKWYDWVTVRNKTWRHRNVVLLGDAAHTAHWSVGSGTKLAMEDAIALTAALERCEDLDTALAAYEADRRVAVERTQAAASESLDWFSRYGRYLGFEPPQFAYSLLTRSKRVTYDNLRLRDPELVGGVERWFGQVSGAGSDGAALLVAPQPAFTPLRLGGVTLVNRVALVADRAGDAVDGTPSPGHLATVERLALGGAGLVVVESVAVSPSGRVTRGDAGLYDDRHTGAWRTVLGRLAGRTSALVGAQLSHAGRRGSTRPRSAGSDRPLRDEAWPLVAASPLPYNRFSPTPAALDRHGMTAVRDDFVAAARRAADAGFDALGLHFGHGYLLASFISPLTNHRDDGYGGDLPARMAFPLEVLAAVRAEWPASRPLWVTVSASDLQPGGLTETEAVSAARLLAGEGADLLDVVAGHTTPAFHPSYDTAFYAPWSDLVRNGASVTTMTSGSIPDTGVVNDLLAAGKADLCVLGRPSPPPPPWLAPAQPAHGGGS